MNIGIVGLGKMGLSIARRLRSAYDTVWCYDIDASLLEASQAYGLKAARSYEELLNNASVLWLMIPAGSAIDALLEASRPFLKPHHIIIDGGNSFYKDSVRRATALVQQGIAYLDCGTSGGLHGFEKGYCLMVGGDKQAYEHVEHFLRVIAAPQGLAYVGPSGAGHYTKMVHNGIEYSLLAVYAEGFALLKCQDKYDFDLEQLSNLWIQGSIIRSWILELLSASFAEHSADLEHISGQLDANGTGHWTLQEAKTYEHAMQLLEYALQQRTDSENEGKDHYANKLVALMRHQFGGHKYYKK